MNLVCFGQQEWEYCWTGKQQLMTRLARRGHRVLYVDPLPEPARGAVAQLGALASGRAYVPGLREFQPGLHLLTHAGAAGVPSHRVRARLRLLALRATCRRLQMLAPVALALRPDPLWLMRSLGPSAIAYYAVDEWTGFGGMADDHRQTLRRAEEELLRHADVALGVSPRLVERFRTIQPHSYHLENGADVEHFSPESLRGAPAHEAMCDMAGPTLGFIGQVDERLDQPLLLSIAAARPHWNIVLAGRVKAGVDVSALAARPNIRLIGYQPYERLPSVLRQVDVCLVPYRETDLTHSCNPLKVYEYLATGRPVVSVPLEGLVACRDVVALARTPEQFIDAVGAALADPEAGRADRLARASAHSWDLRVDELEQRLDEAQERARTDRPVRRRWTSGRRVARVPVRLDARDEAIRQFHHGYEYARLTIKRRAMRATLRAGGWIYYAGRIAARAARRAAGDRRPIAVRKILVVRRGSLGDTVAFLPSLRALRAAYPQARIVLGVQPGMPAVALVTGTGDVDEVRELHFANRRTARARLGGMLQLFAEGYDLIITGVWYSILPEALFTGAPWHVGLYDGHPYQEMCSRAVPMDPTRHEADNHLAVVEALAGPVEPEERVPRVSVVAEETRRGAERLWAALGLDEAAQVIVMHPGSKRASRRWPAERFAELATRLLAGRPERRVVFTGVPPEAPLVAGIRRRIPEPLRSRALSGIGLTDLSGLIGLLDRAALVVCNDTGTMHLARARGTPLVALLGPENDRRWGPYPRGRSAAVALRAVVPCAPCVRWECGPLYCMNSLSVDQVQREVERLLGTVPAAAAAEAGASRRISLATAPEAPAATDSHVPCERQFIYRTWHDLAAAGHPLPLVSLIVLPPELGGLAGTGQLPKRDGVGATGAAAVVASLQRQTYPRLEVVLVESGPAADVGAIGAGSAAELARPAGTGLAVRLVRVPPGRDARAALAAALAACAGEIVVPLVAAPAWPVTRIGSDVAMLVRLETIPAARGSVILRERPARGDWASVVGATWHREALSAWLADGAPAAVAVAATAAGPPFAAGRAAAAREHGRNTPVGLTLGRIHELIRHGPRWVRRTAIEPAPAAATGGNGSVAAGATDVDEALHRSSRASIPSHPPGASR